MVEAMIETESPPAPAVTDSGKDHRPAVSNADPPTPSRRPAPRPVGELIVEQIIPATMIVTLGVWFGLLTGFAESISYWLQLRAGTLPLFKVSSTWAVAAPVGNLCLFLAVAAVTSVFVLSLRVLKELKPSTVSEDGESENWNPDWPIQSAVTVLATVSIATVMTHLVQAMSLGLATWSLWLLSLGGGVQVGKASVRNTWLFWTVVRRSLAVLVAVLAGIVAQQETASHIVSASAAGFDVSEAADESGAATSTVAVARDSPNVLLLVLDTVRAKSLSIYGYEKETTPNLAKLARRGVVFDHAVAPAPWTLPSHASMLTGLPPHEHGADWCSPLPTEHRTVAQAFAASGYRTSAVTGNLYYCGSHTGLHRGFEFFSDASVLSADVFRNCALTNKLSRSANFQKLTGFYDWPGRRYAPEIHSTWLEWLDAQHEGDRFFAMLNYFDVHAPYLPPDDIAAEYAPRNASEKLLMAQWNGCTSQCEKPDATSLKIGQTAYDGCLAALDREIGWLLDELESRGRLQNTVLIITADHGEQFGDHGIVNHGRSLYRSVVQVPLIIVGGANTPAGIRVTESVSLCDLPATMLDFADRHSTTHAFPGKPLTRYWDGESDQDWRKSPPVVTEVSKGLLVPEWLPNAHDSVRSIWHNGYQYIRRSDNGDEELYDLLNDPDELTNLVTKPQGAGPLVECRKAFEEVYGPTFE